MKGFVHNRAEGFPTVKAEDCPSFIRLFGKHKDVEFMQHFIYKGAAVWLTPGQKDEDMEFYLVLSGKLSVEVDGRTLEITNGDSFYTRGLESELHFLALENTILFCCATSPVYDTEETFQTHLKKMILQINEKDNYTFQHSQNVMRYSIKLYVALKERCENVLINQIVMASLFHDIGKIKIPDEILKKTSRLTNEEFKVIQNHPTYGFEILRPYYEQPICDLVLRHHERLDGSGYPMGVKGEEISFPARIIAVADAFDAMTTNRKYNIPKTFSDAALELMSLPHQYDIDITTKLYELILSGELR